LVRNGHSSANEDRVYYLRPLPAWVFVAVRGQKRSKRPARTGVFRRRRQTEEDHQRKAAKIVDGIEEALWDRLKTKLTTIRLRISRHLPASESTDEVRTLRLFELLGDEDD